MGDDELTSKAKRIGIKVFLTKPFKPEELVNSVRSIL
jgi:DNA-binding response OmpR family regulator